jgi:hypothetical protein
MRFTKILTQDWDCVSYGGYGRQGNIRQVRSQDRLDLENCGLVDGYWVVPASQERSADRVSYVEKED